VTLIILVADFLFFAATLKDEQSAPMPKAIAVHQLMSKQRSIASVLKIIDAEIGSFAELDRLNPRFIADSLRMKLCIATTEPDGYYLENFPHLLFRLMEAFPNLRRHDCGAGNEMSGFRDVEITHHLLPFNIVGGVIDTPHLLEHLIIELQCSLARMPVCSGITCGLWEPENRFDVFVECESESMAAFAGRLGVKIVNEVLRRGSVSPVLENLVRLAPLVHENPDWNAVRLARQLAWKPAAARRALKALRELEFPFL
jgi:hypothetical protein